MQLGTTHSGDLLRSTVPLNCVEVAVNEGVRIALPANTCEATMEEASVLQHLPDSGIAPVVGHLLWEDLDLKVIMATFEYLWTRENFIDVDAHHVLSRLFKGIVECLFILLCLSFAIGHETITVSNEDEDTALVHTIQGSDVGN